VFIQYLETKTYNLRLVQTGHNYIAENAWCTFSICVYERTKTSTKHVANNCLIFAIHIANLANTWSQSFFLLQQLE